MQIVRKKKNRFHWKILASVVSLINLKTNLNFNFHNTGWSLGLVYTQWLITCNGIALRQEFQSGYIY